MSFLPQTSGESNGTILRDPTPRDIGKLLELIQESTGGDTKLDSSMLMRDLLCVGYDRPVPKCDDPCIKFDPEVFKNPVPAARAIIAEVERETVGYLIYHYHYSPWMGFGAFVDDVFVSQNFRRKGIARKMIGELSSICKRDGLKICFFKIRNIEVDLITTLARTRPTWYKNKERDWSVYRIDI